MSTPGIIIGLLFSCTIAIGISVPLYHDHAMHIAADVKHEADMMKKCDTYIEHRNLTHENDDAQFIECDNFYHDNKHLGLQAKVNNIMRLIFPVHFDAHGNPEFPPLTKPECPDDENRCG